MPFFIIPVFYLPIYARAGRAWGHLGRKMVPPSECRCPRRRPWHPRLDIYGFFEDPKRHRKNEDFSNPPKSTKMALSIDPGASKARLLIKKLDFWPPFWHRFFDFFQKWRKCEISEEYNAKRGSEPSKTFHFRIVFSSNFHVFSEPPPGGHFSRVKVRVVPQTCDFGAICDFPGCRKWTHILK